MEEWRALWARRVPLRKRVDVGDPRFVCPACGFDELLEPAWDDADAVGGGSQEICPNCKIQFGYDDAAGGDPVKSRTIWRY